MKNYSIIQRNKSTGNMTWYGRIAENGVIRYISLKVTRKADAQIWLDRMNAQKFLPEEKVEKDADIGPSSLAFLESVEAVKGELTVKAYEYRLGLVCEWLEGQGVRTIRAITPEIAQRLVVSVSERFAPKSARETIRLADQFVKWAQRTYGIEGNSPFEGISRPKMVKREKSFWTPEEIDRILDNAPDPLTRAFWSLMAFAGFRHAEAVNFCADDINDGKIQVIGKGNKQAFVPLGDRLRSELERVPLEPRPFDLPMYRFNAVRILERAVRAAGIEGEVTNHKFRHSFASNLIRSGVNIKAVQQLMRHENVQITLDTYSHLIPNDLKSALDSVK